MGDNTRPLLYSVREAADMLGVDPSTLYRLIKQEKVPHRKFYGVGLRFTQADIDQILADIYRPAAA